MIYNTCTLGSCYSSLKDVSVPFIHRMDSCSSPVPMEDCFVRQIFEGAFMKTPLPR